MHEIVQIYWPGMLVGVATGCAFVRWGNDDFFFDVIEWAMATLVLCAPWAAYSFLLYKGQEVFLQGVVVALASNPIATIFELLGITAALYLHNFGVWLLFFFVGMFIGGFVWMLYETFVITFKVVLWFWLVLLKITKLCKPVHC